MQGISHVYDEEAAALEATIKRRVQDRFDVRVLRSSDLMIWDDTWDDTRLIVRTRRGPLSYMMEVSRQMLRSVGGDAAVYVARMIAAEYEKYDREHAA